MPNHFFFKIHEHLSISQSSHYLNNYQSPQSRSYLRLKAFSVLFFLFHRLERRFLKKLREITLPWFLIIHSMAANQTPPETFRKLTTQFYHSTMSKLFSYKNATLVLLSVRPSVRFHPRLHAYSNTYKSSLVQSQCLSSRRQSARVKLHSRTKRPKRWPTHYSMMSKKFSDSF